MIGKIEDIIKEKYDSEKIPEYILNFDIVDRFIEKSEKIFKRITLILIIISIILSILVSSLDMRVSENYKIYSKCKYTCIK